MHDTLRDIFKLHQRIFLEKTRSGFNLKMQKKNSPSSVIIGSICALPTFFSSKDIESMNMRKDFRQNEIRYIKKWDPVTVCGSICDQSKVWASYSPNDTLIIKGKSVFRTFIPYNSLKAVVKSEFVSFLLKHQLHGRDWQYSDIQISIGNHYKSYGLQIYYNYKTPKVAFSLMRHKTNNVTYTEYVLSVDRQIRGVIRYQKQVCPNWRFGVELSIDNKLHCNGVCAWHASINDSQIHSLISSNGIVSTDFRHPLGCKCIFNVCGMLDHYRCQYKFGLGLEWK